MGIKTRLEPVASVGLGTNSVSVLDMASAYATLAAGGIYSEPMAIKKVVLPKVGKVDTDAGWGKPKRKRVFRGRRRLRGDQDPAAEHPGRHRHGQPTSAGRRRERAGTGG